MNSGLLRAARATRLLLARVPVGHPQRMLLQRRMNVMYRRLLDRLPIGRPPQ